METKVMERPGSGYMGQKSVLKKQRYNTTKQQQDTVIIMWLQKWLKKHKSFATDTPGFMETDP